MPIFAYLILAFSPGYGKDKPFWELGLGVGAVSFPHYVGSDERTTLVLPIPYVVYRSERFSVDRNRASSQLFRTDRLRLELDLSGSAPVDSSDNDAREGMPDLDPVIQLGPALQFDVYRTPAERDRLFLELPARAAFSVAFDRVRHIGWVSNPNIQYHGKRQMESGLWGLKTSFGPLFADRRYYRYFYAVEPRFATPRRPPFETSAGFGGWRLSVSLSRRSGDFWYGAFFRYFNLKEAEFSDSPLVKTDHSLLVGLGVAWIFSKSSTEE